MQVLSRQLDRFSECRGNVRKVNGPRKFGLACEHLGGTRQWKDPTVGEDQDLINPSCNKNKFIHIPKSSHRRLVESQLPIRNL